MSVSPPLCICWLVQPIFQLHMIVLLLNNNAFTPLPCVILWAHVLWVPICQTTTLYSVIMRSSPWQHKILQSFILFVIWRLMHLHCHSMRTMLQGKIQEADVGDACTKQSQAQWGGYNKFCGVHQTCCNASHVLQNWSCRSESSISAFGNTASNYHNPSDCWKVCYTGKYYWTTNSVFLVSVWTLFNVVRMYCTLEVVTEPHKLTAAMQCVAAVARPMVQGGAYREGPTHVIPLLMSTLPGIDPNDIKKCFVTFQFISIFVTLVPIVDCSSASEYWKDLTEVLQNS